MSWVILLIFFFTCIIYGQASPDCGAGDVVVENYSCTIRSGNCSSITNLRVRDFGRVTFVDSCDIAGEIHVSGDGAQIASLNNVRVGALSYTIEGATHVFGQSTSLHANSCRIMHHSKIFVPHGVHFECATLLLDKTSSIDATGLQHDGGYSRGLTKDSLQLFMNAETLILLGTVDVSNIHTRCSISAAPCEQSMSVRIQSKNVIFGPTTSFSAIAKESEYSYNADISIVSDSKLIQKWYSLFSRVAFHRLSGTFSFSTLAGMQQTLLLNVDKPNQRIVVDAPTSSTNYRRVLSFADSEHVESVLLKDSPDRIANTPKVKYYITDETVLPKLSVECNVHVYRVPSLSMRELLEYDRLDEFLWTNRPKRLTEWEYSSVCSQSDDIAERHLFPDSDTPATRSLAALPACDITSKIIHVTQDCSISGNVRVSKIFGDPTYIIALLENAYVTFEQIQKITRAHVIFEKNSTMHFLKNGVINQMSRVTMHDKSSIVAQGVFQLGSDVTGYGRISFKAYELRISVLAKVRVINAPDFANPGTPPPYNTNSQGVKAGGCHTGYFGGELSGVEATELLDQTLKGSYLYGNVIYPIDQGSNGAQDSRYPGTFGRGGGAVTIEATNVLDLQGSIDVSGESPNSATQGGGGGSGGSILIKTYQLTGFLPGKLKAAGGNNGRDASSNISGSGGRIALHCYEDLTTEDYMDEAKSATPPTYFDVKSTQNTQGTVWVNCGRHMNTLYLPSTIESGSFVTGAVIDASYFNDVIIRSIISNSIVVIFRLEDNTKPLLVREVKAGWAASSVFLQLAGPGGDFVYGAVPMITNNCYSYTLKSGCTFSTKKYARLDRMALLALRNTNAVHLPVSMELLGGVLISDARLERVKHLTCVSACVTILSIESQLSLDSLYVDGMSVFQIKHTGPPDSSLKINVGSVVSSSLFQIAAKRVEMTYQNAIFAWSSRIECFYMVSETYNSSTGGSMVGKVQGTTIIPSSLSTDYEKPTTPGRAVVTLNVPFASAGSALKIRSDVLYAFGYISVSPRSFTDFDFKSLTSTSSGGSIWVEVQELHVTGDSRFTANGADNSQPGPSLAAGSAGRIAVHVLGTPPKPRASLLLPIYEVNGAFDPNFPCKSAYGTVFLNGDGVKRMLLVGHTTAAACDAATVIGINSDFSVNTLGVLGSTPVEVVALDGVPHEFKVVDVMEGKIRSVWPAVLDLATGEQFGFTKSTWLTNMQALAAQLASESAASNADLTNLVSSISSTATATATDQLNSDETMARLLLCKFIGTLCESSQCDANSSVFMSTGQTSIDIKTYVINKSVYNNGNLEQLLDAFRRNIADSAGVPLNSIQSKLVSQEDGLIQIQIEIRINASSFSRSERVNMEIGLADLSSIYCTGFIST